jgi:cell fate regulator YaaT (PSP1 superfamily)
MQPYIVGVQFQKTGKIYYFDATEFPDLRAGDYVVVTTSRGRHLGEVKKVLTDPPEPPEGGWKKVLRRATPRDLLLLQTWRSKQEDALKLCRERAEALKIANLKIISAEYNYDGSQLTFLYSSEADEKINIKPLHRALQKRFPHTRVDLRQIGPRDVAKIIGGMGACGLEKRCCTRFLTEFNPISIKMAKEQGISLTPSEITGMCGRLRCCLIYEYEAYVEARKTLPRRKRRVITPMGEGKVVDLYPLKQSVIVELEDRKRHEFFRDDIEPWNEQEAARRKSASRDGKEDSVEEKSR